jgi:lactate dehydrogenase-like 2-hydroxyacid dehydrogenase
MMAAPEVPMPSPLPGFRVLVPNPLPAGSLAPHIGSASVATREAMADLVVENLTSWTSIVGAVTPVA